MAQPGDPYQEFLLEQKKREEEWETNRRTCAAKRQRKEEVDSPDVGEIKKQLEAKTRECDLLKNRILDNERLFKVSRESVKNQIKLCQDYEWPFLYYRHIMRLDDFGQTSFSSSL